jgi:cysteine-rich repeat protein
MMKILVLPALLCGVIVWAPQRATAATDPLLKCASSKLKATGKKESGKLGCLSKNAAKPDPTKLSDCIMKVESKFAPAFDKADSKGVCAGRSQDLEATANACVQSIAAAIPPPVDSCNVPTGFCVTATTRPCKADLDCLLPKCTSAKLKAAGKAAAGGLNCYAKAVGKGLAVDPTCLAKADDGLTAALTKADAKGACPPPVNAGVNGEVTGQCVVPVQGQLPGKAPGCGNGVVESYLGETCDDGNTKDGDTCPASCHVDSCTPVTPSSFGAHVTFTSNAGSTIIAGLGYFVDYPEGKVTAPGATAPFGVSNSLNDLGYGFNDNEVKVTGLPSPMLTLTFETCQGAPAATAADFSCTVTDASDDSGNVVDPSLITCAVTVP